MQVFAISDKSPCIDIDLGDGIKRRGFLSHEELNQIDRLFPEITWGGFHLLYSLKRVPFKATYEIIRYGLIGGGGNPQEVNELISYWCRPPRPIVQMEFIADSLLWAARTGIYPKGEGKPISEKEISKVIDEIKAKMARANIPYEYIKGFSIAELFMFLDDMEDKKDLPNAPSQEVHDAIKKLSEQ